LHDIDEVKILIALEIGKSVRGIPIAIFVFDTTEAVENNISTIETASFEQTTNNNIISVQKVKQGPVGRASDISIISSDSSGFSDGAIADILVGAIGGILFCCCCLCILARCMG